MPYGCVSTRNLAGWSNPLPISTSYFKTEEKIDFEDFSLLVPRRETLLRLSLDDGLYIPNSSDMRIVQQKWR